MWALFRSASITGQSRTTLWGTTTWNRDASVYTPLRFPGQHADHETGLHDNLFRHYDPDTARFTSPDPLGLAPAPTLSPTRTTPTPGATRSG
ncbi:RHS repeat-associated core domain-containing protein [Streptomyces sp. JCM 35825]|nr:RHS repeat-associated core domain-containing protein [Streptomyces sp. JCM 35825]WCL83529.1 RHS repeat-associated core domain-containing protein [Streptomyces sp. JCM 35825]